MRGMEARFRRFMRIGAALCAVVGGLCLWPLVGHGQAPEPRPVVPRPTAVVSLDFNEVELPVFARYMSDVTGKNIILDEKVKGKVSIFSPVRVSREGAYHLFLSALALKGLAVVETAEALQIVPTLSAPPERVIAVYRLQHSVAPDLRSVLSEVVSRSSAIQPVADRPQLRPQAEFEGLVQVFADKPTNSLIVTSTNADQVRIKQIIHDLDVPRNQVYVEAVIMEIGVDRLRQIGSEPLQALGAAKAGSLQGIAGFNRVPEEIASIAQTLSGQAGAAVSVLNTASVRLFLQLLMTLSDSNILSTPQLLATDNEKAKIVVGENRPFPTGQSQTVGGNTILTIERKDVGITLEITSQVMDNNMVRLLINQEITAIAENVAQTIGTGTALIPVGPTTTKRAMSTLALARDQQTIVLGGLVRDNVIQNERKIPFLGDIPVLGWLFRFQSKQTEKLSLLIFLTPHVLRTQTDVADLNVRKAVEAGALLNENRITEETGVKKAVAEHLLAPPPEERPPEETPAGGKPPTEKPSREKPPAEKPVE